MIKTRIQASAWPASFCTWSSVHLHAPLVARWQSMLHPIRTGMLCVGSEFSIIRNQVCCCDSAATQLHVLRDPTMIHLPLQGLHVADDADVGHIIRSKQGKFVVGKCDPSLNLTRGFNCVTSSAVRQSAQCFGRVIRCKVLQAGFSASLHTVQKHVRCACEKPGQLMHAECMHVVKQSSKCGACSAPRAQARCRCG